MAEYLQFRGVSSDLKRRVRRHFGTCWKRSPLPYEEAAILADLSAPLRAEVVRARYGHDRQHHGHATRYYGHATRYYGHAKRYYGHAKPHYGRRQRTPGFSRRGRALPFWWLVSLLLLSSSLSLLSLFFGLRAPPGIERGRQFFFILILTLLAV